MRKIVIATPSIRKDGLGAYAKIKNEVFNTLGCDSVLIDISNDGAYKKLVDLVENYNEDRILYVFLEFEMNVLKRKRPLEELELLFQNRHQNIQLAIMFHELWDKTSGPPFLRNMKSSIKQLLIRKFIYVVKPNHVFTNSYYNKIKLQKLGIESSFHPVYSNMRITHFNKTKEAGMAWLSKNGLDFINKQFNIGIIFGVVDERWEYLKALSLLSEASLKENKPLHFLYVGPYGHTPAFQTFTNAASPFSNIINLGLLSEEDVCHVIAAANFGFCTTPLAMASRSGSLAALLEAELPVIVSDSEKLGDFEFDKIGLPKAFFWDTERMEQDGFPKKEAVLPTKKINYRLEVGRKILEAL